jgi:hypothetical protein
MLAQMRGAHYVDLAIMNRVNGGAKALKALGNELHKKIRCGVWATLGGIANQQHALKVSQANPLVATEGAGSVFAFVGLAKHRGLPAVISAAVLGMRLGLDPRFNDKEAGPMTACFGPQSFKNCVGIDELDTADWEPDVLTLLADTSGFNVVIRHTNGVLSPYLARTLCSLENYMYLDASRMVSLLTGFIMAYLDVEAPGCQNVPREQRALCDQAMTRFFEPYMGREGFEGRLEPLTTSRGTRFELAMIVCLAAAIERIVVIRKFKSKK